MPAGRRDSFAGRDAIVLNDFTGPDLTVSGDVVFVVWTARCPLCRGFFLVFNSSLFFSAETRSTVERTADMLKFIRGKGQQPSAERQKIQKDLFAFRRVKITFVFFFSRTETCIGRQINFAIIDLYSIIILTDYWYLSNFVFFSDRQLCTYLTDMMNTLNVYKKKKIDF